jgi:hypothetical protein
MMPRDTNPQGTIFGGVLLSNIDQAGAVGASHEIRQKGWPTNPLITVETERDDCPLTLTESDPFFLSLTCVRHTAQC